MNPADPRVCTQFIGHAQFPRLLLRHSMTSPTCRGVNSLFSRQL